MIDASSIDAFGWCLMAYLLACAMVLCDFPVRLVK